jgi:hypothetical protein
MIDERLRESLPWLYRLEAARRRAIAWSSISMLMLFIAAQGMGAQAWSMHCGPVAQGTIGVAFGGALAVLAAVAFRWDEAATWIAMLCTTVLAFALGEAL